MRKYGYRRPSATLMVTRKRTTRRKKPSFFFTFLFVFVLLGVLGWSAFIGVRYAYVTLKNAQIADWHVKSVTLSGVSGQREKEIFTRAASLEGKPFSMADADKLRQELAAKYPMLTGMSVSRGLLSGTLKISARPRQPVAQFVLPDHSRKYIDEDSVIYADPQEERQPLKVELIGDVPAKLQPSFVELVQSLLKLKKALPFESLEFNLTTNTVSLRLPDGSSVFFGPALHLKAKVHRAAQIMELARTKYAGPVTLNFEFYEKGKVFLTQTAH